MEFVNLACIGAAMVFALFTLTWLLARTVDNYSVVDVAWSYALTPLVLWYAFAGSGLTSRKILAAALGLFWSLRLGTYLLRRVAGHHPHEDVRYVVLRERWKENLGGAFFWFFQAQALLILLLSFPLLLACINPASSLNLMEWIGVGVWLIGVGGEALSDAQMANFNTLITQARAVPEMQGGQMVGFRLMQIQPGSFYEKIGLKIGDIITSVNGEKITDAAKALSVLQELKHMNSLDLGLQRNGVEVNKNYDIQ